MKNSSASRFALILPALFILLVLSNSAWSVEPGRDEFIYARKLLDERYYDLAAEQLERLLRDHPNFTDAAEAQYLLGEAYLNAGEYDLSRSAYLRMAIVYPKSHRAPEAMFKVGYALELAGRPLDAAEAYTRIQGFYPSDRHAPQGLKKAAGLYLAGSDTVRAETTMDRLVELYPESEAADASRLYKAKMLIRQGDRDIGKRYLEWLASRSPTDTIVATAWLELGRLARTRMKFDEATEAFRQPIVKYPDTDLAMQAAIELTDLYNYRGMIKAALETIKPVLTSTDSTYFVQAHIKAGDAFYRVGNQQEAFAYYDKVASQDAEAALKSAWTNEMMGHKEEALQKYLQLVNLTDEQTKGVKLLALQRAAVVSSDLRKWELSAGLWSELIGDKDSTDTTGRSLYEAAKVYVNAGKSIQPIAQAALKASNISPWRDELAFLAYTDTMQSTIEEKVPRAPDLHRYLAVFPASSYLDSAQVIFDYFQRHFVRSGNLMERMAELSSSPPGSVSKTQWAFDWGDFYLFEFKDPVKALDQYTMVIDDTSATADKQLYAHRRSLQAYLFLYESALWEGDDFEIEMYGDSARSWHSQLRMFNVDVPETMVLTAELLRLDLVRFKNDRDEYEAVLDSIGSAIKTFGADRFTPSVMVDYLRAELDIGRMDSTALETALSQVMLASNSTADRRISAELNLTAVILNEYLERYENAVDLTVKLVSDYPETPAGAEAVVWLIENPRLLPDIRYEWLRTFTREYPYLLRPYADTILEAELLDLLNRSLDALESRNRAELIADWGKPRLDILKTPDEASLYQRGTAFRYAAKLTEALDQYRILLNLGCQGKYASAALLAMAEILYELGDARSALAYLDTLNRGFTSSNENTTGIHLRPILLMSLEEYGHALSKWRELISFESDPDSLFHFSVQTIICQYRTGRLEEARLAAKQLYKDFKKRDDLDQYKALFYLEKGQALDKVRRFEEARDQYKTIQKSYALTPWVDDAAYSNGWSFIQQGKIEEGSAELEQFIENYPESHLIPQARLTIGLAYYRVEKFSESISALKKVWEDEDAREYYLQAFEAMNKVYRDAHFWDAAIRLTRDYLARFPEAFDRLDKQMNIGWFYLQIGQWDDAIRYYQPLLPIADAEHEAEVQFYIGEAYMNKGDYRTAILEYLKVKVLGRKTKLDWGVTALYKAGNCYEKLGDNAGAARMYRKIIAESGATSNYGMTAQKRLDALETK